MAKSTESSPIWLRAGTDQLLRMRKAELDELFSMSPAGEIPTGRGRGTVLFATGTPVARLVAKLAYLLAWRGKVFDHERGDLRNIVSPFGVRAIRARVRAREDGRLRVDSSGLLPRDLEDGPDLAGVAGNFLGRPRCAPYSVRARAQRHL